MSLRLTCANVGCHMRFYLDEDIAARLRASRETFYCPYGHAQSFNGPTQAEDAVAAANAETARLRQLLSEERARNASIPSEKEARLAMFALNLARTMESRGPYLRGALRRKLHVIATTGDLPEAKE